VTTALHAIERSRSLSAGPISRSSLSLAVPSPRMSRRLQSEDHQSRVPAARSPDTRRLRERQSIEPMIAAEDEEVSLKLFEYDRLQRAARRFCTLWEQRCPSPSRWGCDPTGVRSFRVWNVRIGGTAPGAARPCCLLRKARPGRSNPAYNRNRRSRSTVIMGPNSIGAGRHRFLLRAGMTSGGEVARRTQNSGQWRVNLK
jgi:hypothetical protein